MKIDAIEKMQWLRIPEEELHAEWAVQVQETKQSLHLISGPFDDIVSQFCLIYREIQDQ